MPSRNWVHYCNSRSYAALAILITTTTTTLLVFVLQLLSSSVSAQEPIGNRTYSYIDYNEIDPYDDSFNPTGGSTGYGVSIAASESIVVYASASSNEIWVVPSAISSYAQEYVETTAINVGNDNYVPQLAVDDNFIVVQGKTKMQILLAQFDANNNEFSKPFLNYTIDLATSSIEDAVHFCDAPAAPAINIKWGLIAACVVLEDGTRIVKVWHNSSANEEEISFTPQTTDVVIDNNINSTAFGQGIALDMPWLVVSDPSYDSDTGTVFVFNESDDKWDLIYQIPGLVQGSQYGYSVSSRDNYIAIGAPNYVAPNGITGLVDVWKIGAETFFTLDQVCGLWATNAYQMNHQPSRMGIKVLIKIRHGIPMLLALDQYGATVAALDWMPSGSLGCNNYVAYVESGTTAATSLPVLAAGSDYIYLGQAGSVNTFAYCTPGYQSYVGSGDSLPKCYYCGVGYYTSNFRASYCMECDNIPYNAVTNYSAPAGSCGYICDKGYFGDTCSLCSEYAQEQHWQLPDTPHMTWVDYASTCYYDCEPGYVLAWDPIRNRQMCIGSPLTWATVGVVGSGLLLSLLLFAYNCCGCCLARGIKSQEDKRPLLVANYSSAAMTCSYCQHDYLAKHIVKTLRDTDAIYAIEGATINLNQFSMCRRCHRRSHAKRALVFLILLPQPLLISALLVCMFVLLGQNLYYYILLGVEGAYVLCLLLYFGYFMRK